MKYFSIIDHVLNEEDWKLSPERKYLSGHMYRNSPYETDDSCGNCDGARCDFCESVTVPPHFSYCVEYTKFEASMIAAGVPELEARDIALKEGSLRSGDCIVIYPNERELKDKHPEFYNKLADKYNLPKYKKEE